MKWLTELLWAVRCTFVAHHWSPVRTPGYNMGLYFWRWVWRCPCGETPRPTADIRKLPEHVQEIKKALGRNTTPEEDRRDYYNALVTVSRYRI